MKKYSLGVLFGVVLCAALVGSVYATAVTVESSITQDFHVVFTFSDINSSIYQNLKSNGLMTKDTVPTALFDSMTQKERVEVETYSPAISFDDATLSIVSSFNIRGPSVVNSTVNIAAKTETFTMDTTWRKFFLNVIGNFQFDFATDFAQPVSQWPVNTTGDVRSYSFSGSSVEGGFSFSFQLPNYASNIDVVGDTISFDAPYQTTFTDNFINSPILILVALTVVGLIIYIYRSLT